MNDTEPNYAGNTNIPTTELNLTLDEEKDNNDNNANKASGHSSSATDGTNDASDANSINTELILNVA